MPTVYVAGAPMKDQLIIEHPDPSSLTIKKTRVGGLLNVISTLAFFIIWYGFLLGEPLSELWRTGQLITVLSSVEGWSTLWGIITRDNPGLWIFIIAPLFALPQLLRTVKISLFGEVLHFDGIARNISRDGKQRSLFADSRNVVLRTVVDSEGPDDHRVSVLLKDGSSLFVTESDNYEQMANLAGDIARVLNTGVIKGRG
jgi:hypothetical protein